MCNHVAGIGAMDFLVVPTNNNFRLLFVLVILRHERKRLICGASPTTSDSGVDRAADNRGVPTENAIRAGVRGRSPSSDRPRVAFKVNILGMDNVFDAARLVGCNRVAYASSLAVSGEQRFYGDRLVTEDDFRQATCNTQCTRSSTSGKRRTSARSMAWRSLRSDQPM